MGPVGYPCASALALPAVIRHSMSMNRRRFLQLSTSAAGLFALRPLFAADDAGAPISKGASFLLASDTHYIANKEQPDAMDETSREINARLVEWLNKLPGTDIPAEAGGGEEDGVHGVIHSGDLIDSGDKTDAAHEAMQKTEWSAFASDWGLNGGDGKLRWAVREIHGNHDGPHGETAMVDAIKARNKKRSGLTGVSENGLHYSWDWAGVHFVALGIIVGDTPEVARKRRYGALGSLPFLQRDLADNVGTSGRPVVLIHHVDVSRLHPRRGASSHNR